MSESGTIVDAYSVEMAVKMLKEHLADEDIAPLIDLLEQLVADPHNEGLKAQVTEEYAGLGSLQGAVLTYAPCLSIVMSENPFKERD